jgi:hypothetical protein
MNFGRADLKEGMSLKFEECEEEEYYGHELTLLWMRVLNLPEVLQSYEVIWAIGTMFGTTQRVDMITTRKNKFGRFQIAVMNPSVMPTRMDVVIGARFFELQFKIEQYAPTRGASLFLNRNNEEGENNGQTEGDNAMNKTNRGPMIMGGTSGASQQNACSSGMTEDITLEDLDDDDLLDEEWELNDTCLDDHGSSISDGLGMIQVTKAGPNPSHQELIQHRAEVAIMVEDAMVAPQMPAIHNSPTLSLGPLLDRALEGIKGKTEANASNDLRMLMKTPPPHEARPKAASTPSRHSKRREGSTSKHLVERVARMVAKKNLEELPGNCNNSILSFSNEHMTDSIESIGISIGDEIKNIQSSVLLIKNVERDRLLLPAKHYVDDSLDVNDSDCDIDQKALSHLCGDLTEETGDITNSDHLEKSKLHKLSKSKVDLRGQTQRRFRRMKN